MINNLKIDEIDLNAVNLVDIRTYEEVCEGMVDGAIWVLVSENTSVDVFINALFESEYSNGADPKKPIALICESGNRSMRFSQKLDKNGIDVINVLGGMQYARTCKNIKMVSK